MSRSRIPKALRAKVAAQARYRCGYCLTAESIVGTSMELDHLIPEALGGLTGEDNSWSEGGSVITGRTPAGRATVAALHLNRPTLVLARRAWVAVGWHPPKD